MDNKANDTFAFDLENRLDDFFSDALAPQDDPPSEESAADQPASPLKDLKSTILAIDWEITDDALEAFVGQVDDLMEQFSGDQVTYTLLKLLKSLGKYIRTHKSKAHPDTIKRIMAIFSTLEKSLADSRLSQNEKEKLLLEEVKQFQLLKSKIIESKSPHQAGGSHKPAQSEDVSGANTIIEAINDLKSWMKAELHAIREEIDQLRNQ